MKKPKLFANFRRNHLVSLIGFRVDLYDKNPPFGDMQESAMFEIEEVDWENKKIIVRLIHVVYDKNVGRHTEDSWERYEIDLSKKWKSKERSIIKSLGTGF